jgi:hypothetical protein
MSDLARLASLKGVKPKKEFNPFNFESVADWLDWSITDKMENNCKDDAERSIYFHMRAYFRILQLQLNLSKAKGENAQDLATVIASILPDELKKIVLEEVEKRVVERNSKIIEEMNDG